MTITFEAKIAKYELVQDGADHSAPTEETIIPDDVKLPDDSPARCKVLRTGGKKWYLTVVYHEDTEQPFALFCKTNATDKSAPTSDAVDRLVALAHKKGIAAKHIKSTVEKTAGETNVGKLTRVISLLLRHGVLIKNIVSELDKMEDVFVGSFLFQIKKFLSQYVKDGEKVEDGACGECGGTLVFSEGCMNCLDCGGSKCS